MRHLGLCAALACAGAAWATPPTITSTPATSGRAAERYRYDADGRAEAAGTVPLEWSLVQAPPGMDVDNLTGELFWVPAEAGSFTVELQARNVDGSATQVFVVDVDSEQPPLVFDVPGSQLALGEPSGWRLEADGARPLLWSLAQGPVDAYVDPVSGLLAWTPRKAGAFSFTVRATNAVGSHERSFTVEVVDAPLPAPEFAVRTWPEAAAAPMTLITFDLVDAVSKHPASALMVYEFDYGDGTPVWRSAEPSANHAYALPGAYTARLRATNAYWRTTERTVTINVGVARVGARIIAEPAAGPAPLFVNFSCDCVSDVGLTPPDWEFGDGTEGPADLVVTHGYARPGGYHARVTQGSLGGAEATDRVFISVRDGERIPPLAVARASPVVGDAPLAVQLVSDFGDEDGTVVSRRWLLPDGTAVENQDPRRTFTQVGVYRATLEVTDNHGLVSRDTVDIQVTRNGALPPKVLSRPNLQATVGQAWAYDEDGRVLARGSPPLTFELGRVVDGQVVDAPLGLVVNETTGLLSWTPTAAQAGEQTVSVRVSNQAGVDVQTFVVSVADDGAPPRGCGCGSAPGGALAAVLAALALALVRPRAGVRARSGTPRGRR